jgi:hypothetical protein
MGNIEGAITQDESDEMLAFILELISYLKLLTNCSFFALLLIYIS